MVSRLRTEGVRHPGAAVSFILNSQQSALRRRTDQIPFVASDVEEYGDAAIRHHTGCPHEMNTGRCHPRVHGIEILHVEEETDPTRCLLPDDSGLVFSVSPGEEQAGDGTWRPDNYPPFGTPVIGQGWGVFHQLETKRVHEEADRWVVVADDDGDEAEIHRASIRRPALSSASRRTPRPAWSVGTRIRPQRHDSAFRECVAARMTGLGSHSASAAGRRTHASCPPRPRSRIAASCSVVCRARTASSGLVHPWCQGPSRPAALPNALRAEAASS